MTAINEVFHHPDAILDFIFILDIMREDMKHDDPRLQSVISE